MLRGDLLDRIAEQDCVVRGGHRLSVTHVDLDLPRPILGVGSLDRDPEVHEMVAHRCQHGLVLGAARYPVALDVVVARQLGHRIEQIELDLEADVDQESHRLGPLQHLLQCPAWGHHQLAAVLFGDVAEHHRRTGTPRHTPQRVNHRMDVHVRPAPLGRQPLVAVTDLAPRSPRVDDARHMQAGLHYRRPRACGHPFATQHPIGIGDGQLDGMDPFRQLNVQFSPRCLAERTDLG